MDSLQSWSTLKDSTLRYFSGTATYSKSFTHQKIETWKTPYTMEITRYLKAGNNSLEVRVTNLWTNRMQGDKNLPPDQRFTFATNTLFGNSMEPPGIQLIPSGLIGPVTITRTNR